MKNHRELVLYLESLIVILNSLDERTENDIKLSVSMLNDVKKSIDSLITNLQKLDN